MGAEERDNELTDVALCYQSMGLPLDATPVQIEQMYKSLTEENRKNLASPDPGIREDARRNMGLVDEMYDKIRSSITYRAFEKEHQKKNDDAWASEARVKRPVHRVVAESSRMMHCPRCNGSIAKGLKTCPVCKTRLYTATERILKTYLTPAKLIILCVVLVLAALLIYRALQTDKPKDGMTELDSLEQKLLPK
jgi:hypothetical protein